MTNKKNKKDICTELHDTLNIDIEIKMMDLSRHLVECANNLHFQVFLETQEFVTTIFLWLHQTDAVRQWRL